LKEKMESSKKISPKKVPRSLNNLLKVEQDLKKNEFRIKKSSKESQDIGKRKF